MALWSGRHAHDVPHAQPLTNLPVRGAWNNNEGLDKAYPHTIDQVLARSGIFVNLHKGCGEAHNPITFRVPKLLNAERLVLSERAHPLDEKEFAGIVSFYDGLPALATAFEQLTRDGSWQAKAREAAARFRVRFAPQRVLRRAGVLELLNASGRRAARHAQRGEVPRGVSMLRP